jgi:membrane-associated phospholipid phosphatase
MLRRATLLLPAVVALHPLGAQRGDTVAAPGARFALTGAVLFATSLATDASFNHFSLRHRGRALDHLANIGNELGTGRNDVGALVLVYVGSRLARKKSWSDGVLHVAAAYAAGDLLESTLKPLVGRERPNSTDSPWQFRPLSGAGSHHSFPSAHAMHAFTLAAAATEGRTNLALRGAAFAGAGLVAWSRVYDRQHWGSDVVASGVLGTATAILAVKWLRARELRRRSPRREIGCVPS